MRIIARKVDACDAIVKQESEASLPTSFGEFRIIAYSNNFDGKDHIALVKGTVKGRENVLLRVHSKCLTGDTFFSLRCDCGPQLKDALKKIQKEGAGIIIYMDQEGRGIGIMDKIKAYTLQDKGLDTVEANEKLGLKADSRSYQLAAKIIESLGPKSVRLITNNPGKIDELKACGIKITDRVPSRTKPNVHNRKYLSTKRSKMGHMISDHAQ